MDIREHYKKTMDEVHIPEKTLQGIQGKTQIYPRNTSAKKAPLFVRYGVCAAMIALLAVVVLQTNLIAYAADSLKSLWIGITGNSYQIVGSLEPKGFDVTGFTQVDRNQDTAAFEKTFHSVSEIAGEYNVELLQSHLAYAWDEAYTVLAAYGEEGAINGIRIIAPYYIMGDLPVEPDVIRQPSSADIIPDALYGSEREGFDFYREYTYQSPIYYSAYINESGEYEDFNTGGCYEVEGVVITEYVSKKSNIEAVIVSYPLFSAAGDMNPVTRAHFIYDGIEYRLEGRVQPRLMEKIIDTLQSKK